MKYALVVPIFLYCLSALADTSKITVKGEAEAQLPPDFVTVTASVATEAKNAQKAKEQVDGLARVLVKAIRSFDIKDEDLGFSGIAVEKKYEYDRNENNKFVGYIAEREFEIKLRDFNKYELFVQEISKAGATQIDTPEAGVDDETALKIKALKEATEVARRKAIEIADGLGVKIGKPIEIGENRLPTQKQFEQRYADGRIIEEIVVTARRQGQPEPLLFVPSDIVMEATVWVRFALEENE